jgi:lipopolysaccharide biosynthesis glycosyltransferase
VNHPDTVCFHKYLLCSQPWASEYDYIIYIDADILINDHAPGIPFHLLGNGIGMVDEYSQPTPQRRIAVQIKNGWLPTATDYFKLCGYHFVTERVFNGGLMVFQPSQHRGLCEMIFSKHVKSNIGHPRGFHFEQTTTNYELQRRHMVSILPNEFNGILAIAMSDDPKLTVDDFFNRNYFTHFAGRCYFEWVEKFTAEQGLDKVQRSNPDETVLDSSNTQSLPDSV